MHFFYFDLMEIAVLYTIDFTVLGSNKMIKFFKETCEDYNITVEDIGSINTFRLYGSNENNIRKVLDVFSRQNKDLT